jgi:hypothetical protein
MHLHADDATWLVPPHRAVWLPAGMTHVEELHAPVSVRNLYFGPGLAKGLPRTCCMVNISPLLRELIQHTSRIGALDRKKPAHAHLISVLLDSLLDVSDVPLQLPTPRDPRARRPAESCAARLMARCRSRRSRATPARAAARWSGSFSPRPG